MHEYGLAGEIADGVKAAIARSGAQRVAALDVEIGALVRLDLELLAGWLREALGDAAGADARIRVRKAPLRIVCLRCGHRRVVVSDDAALPWPEPEDWRCARCRSDEVRVDGHGGCRIGALRLES